MVRSKLVLAASYVVVLTLGVVVGTRLPGGGPAQPGRPACRTTCC